MREKTIVGLALLPLVLTGCVQLCGQRVSLRYDEPKDELHLLILYDGIHDSGSTQHGEGAKQIPVFVEQGDLFLVDWPFYVSRKLIQESFMQPEGTPPAQRTFGKAVLDSLRCVSLGHYRDPEGRIGAAQHVVLPGAKALAGLANAALSEELLQASPQEGSEPKNSRTNERLRQAAREGRAWIALDGHSLLVSFPVHPREWAVEKMNGLAGLLTRGIEGEAAANGEAVSRQILRNLQYLTCAPVSLSESGGEVTLRVGDKMAASTLRFRLREKYEPSLEEVVVKSVPRSLDEAMSQQLLAGPDAKADENLAALLDWGPPEERVRVLLAVAEGREEAAAQKAVGLLQEFAQSWNREQVVPPAPADSADLAAYLGCWKTWYRKMIAFPLEE
ncbi:MAG: hypothetical protein HYU36_14990 [Planctomycetes bacterium]|nr:hypothetical protein [Planctomycetota bacterium]